MTLAHIGLGGNQRHPRKQIAAALRRLAAVPGAKLRARSKMYYSAPVECPGRQPTYANAVAEMQTLLPPGRLFKHLQAIQHQMHRRRRPPRAPRILDVDYLLHGPARLRSPKLTLPHPRMTARAFVLRPLADIRGEHYGGLKNAARLRLALSQCRRQSIKAIPSS